MGIGEEWIKPNLGRTEWPAGSGDTANNILFTFGMGSTGGAGTGITLDTTSGQPLGPPTCRAWTATNYSDCNAARHSGSQHDAQNHTTCGGGSHRSVNGIDLAACRAVCSADLNCGTVQWQGTTSLEDGGTVMVRGGGGGHYSCS